MLRITLALSALSCQLMSRVCITGASLSSSLFASQTISLNLSMNARLAPGRASVWYLELKL